MLLNFELWQTVLTCLGDPFPMFKEFMSANDSGMNESILYQTKGMSSGSARSGMISALS